MGLQSLNSPHRMREADELVRLMLDAMPLCCNIWDENYNSIDCNQEAVNLFELRDKQEFLERFFELSPEYQPDGRPSRETALKMIEVAFEKGRAVFEWLHCKLDGEPVPAEVTLVRLLHHEQHIVVGYIHDLRALRASMQKTREADERVRIMLDATPLCSNFWDENYNNIDCNQEAVNLFELRDKQEYLERFFELSPKYQPDGRLSEEKALEMITKAFTEGRSVFEWMHQKLNGDPVPSEITLVRVEYGGKYIVAGYTRDLRALKASMEETREADERARIMLDATPLCSNFWDEKYANVDCNEEAVKLFGLRDKREYLEHFFELSPEYQPDGRLSKEKAFKKVKQAFETGRAHFEWMHQKLSGEPIPSEITLVRVKRKGGYIVVGYTRDLRELKETVGLLNQLERLAFTDSLTGMYNRRHFIDNAQKAFSNYPDNQQAISIIMMDLDFFKRINDTYGHAAGDEVLRSVAQATQSVLRSNDLLARYGGEEFIIMVFHSDQKLALSLAERIRRKIKETQFIYQDKRIALTISLGVATKDDASISLEETIELADKALYKAKSNGRDRVESV